MGKSEAAAGDGSKWAWDTGWSRWKTDGGRRLEKSDREKKGRKGSMADESTSKLLRSVTASRTGRWMPVGVLSEQPSTFCCTHLSTSSPLARPPTARKHIWHAQWILQGAEHVWGLTQLIYVAPVPEHKSQQTLQLSSTRCVKQKFANSNESEGDLEGWALVKYTMLSVMVTAWNQCRRRRRQVGEEV